MKNFKTFGIAFIALLMAIACEKSADNFDLDINNDLLKSSKLGSSEDPGGKMVTVPFKANFYTDEESLIIPDDCEFCDDCEDCIAINTQVGGGEATHLGGFTTTMVFLMNMTTYEYSFAEDGSFVAANGDELYFKVDKGIVIPSAELDDPYIAYFKDKFIFTGGTGRFKDASGEGYTNSLTTFIHTDHVWTGTLKLKKGSK